MNNIFLLFLWFIAVLLYLIPSFVGWNKKNINSIFTLNILLGWTFIGWVVALVWAVSKDNEQLVTTSNNNEKLTQLIELKKLLEEGYLTDIEFEKQKKEILNLK
tara:strand:- start:212 stop:523 length:312 start_codon:yes stop_codon:yes gene_type:complete